MNMFHGQWVKRASFLCNVKDNKFDWSLLFGYGVWGVTNKRCRHVLVNSIRTLHTHLVLLSKAKKIRSKSYDDTRIWIQDRNGWSLNTFHHFTLEIVKRSDRSFTKNVIPYFAVTNETSNKSVCGWVGGGRGWVGCVCVCVMSNIGKVTY